MILTIGGYWLEPEEFKPNKNTNHKPNKNGNKENQ